MGSRRQQQFLTGIEIGTSTIKVLICQLVADGTLEVLGFSEQASLKMCKGEAQNTRIVEEQLLRAMSEARDNAGIAPEDYISLFFFALSGDFIETRNVTGKIEVTSPGCIIKEDDFAEAMRQTNDILVPADKHHLSSMVNRLYRLADGRVLFNPIGQCSETLEVETQHFFADYSRANTTISMVLSILNEKLDAIIYTPLTLESALLKQEDDDEKPLLVDIGAGLTSVAVPTSVGHLYCGQIGVGCDHIANDISLAFDLPIKAARMILQQMGALHCTAVATHDGQARLVNCASTAQSPQRMIPASSLEIVVEARLQELFELIRNRLEEQQVYSWVGNRVILSGGGALIPRINELAARVFNRPRVETASPFDVSGRADFQPLPQYTTVIGLIRAGYHDYLTKQEVAQQKRRFFERAKHIINVVRDW